MFQRMVLLGTIVTSLFCGVVSCSEAGKGGDLTQPLRPAGPAAIVISPDSSVLTVGDTIALHASLLDADGNSIKGTPTSWTVSDTTVAKISAMGVVTGLGAGQTTVTAQLGGEHYTARVWIQGPTAASVDSSVRPSTSTTPATTPAPVTTTPPITTPPSATSHPTTVPPVTVPPTTVPPVTVPPTTVPPVTVPPTTVPPVTVPPTTVPPVTAPPVTAPPVTAPPVTAPPVTAPPVQVPPIPKPTVVRVTISPKSSTTKTGVKVQFSTRVNWSDGQSHAFTVAYSAAGGSITNSGLYSAGAVAGTYRVVALCNCGKADTATVLVQTPPPTLTTLVVTPASISVTSGGKQQFVSSGLWSDGSKTAPLVAWSATGGTITAAGLYTAGPAPGSYRVIAVQKGGQRADTVVINVTAASTQRPLWSADMETGDLTQWSDNVGNKYYQPVCGGQFITGTEAITVPSTDHARSGRWSAKMTIGGNDTAVSPNGTRMMRWCEIQENRELYYSVWYYIPQKLTISPNGWTNLFQFKSTYDASGASDAFFYLDLRNAPTGEMRFMLTWYTGLKVEGPSPGLSGYRTWKTTQDIPVGRWFHVQARYVCAGDFTGAVQVWQDGVEIFHLEGVRTRYPTGRCVWSANNYGTGISPSPATIYIDDAAISLFKINQ